ncbi:MAG TPA: hypothetical protein VMW79_08000 [Anaerolineae bacterium]|nr:hypothetical protein [Anaerolineae bacterium]
MTSINVMGVPYTLELVDVVDDQDDTIIGRVVFEEQKIQVRSSMGPEAVRATVLHELIHAIDNECNLGRNGHLPEAIVSRVASSLFITLALNPSLAKRLFDV